MTDLSPAAQAVYDAVTVEAIINNADWPVTIAAALRAAANHLDHPTSAHTLYAFADELEKLDD
jgi:hypothetical protein